MFRVAFLALFVASVSAHSHNIKWADLVESRTYKLDRELTLSYNKSTYKVEANEELRLLDFRPLSMINVFLAEFKILNCSKNEFSSEMILANVGQPSGQEVSVGVDMAEKCILEVFIEKKDYNAVSILR
ncbi:MAG: hypothetical protein KC478_09920 [Bacteriovoracaceae bacterium]|nr:hypothetical protein [Bacteriovoracaceae bacterium]